MVRAVEKVVFIFAHLRQNVSELRIDMHMAGGARTASATEGQYLVETVVSNGLHQGETFLNLNGAPFPIAVRDINLDHAIFPVSIELDNIAPHATFPCA